ncbi:MAG TPA: glutamate 5-kinase [Micropruina sp.]|nr:glutamate 5-kinase [Micropruina sp.]
MADRPQIANAQRIVVKVGSSSLTGLGGLHSQRMHDLVATLAELRNAGRDVVLVSSGAVAAGMPALRMKHRPRDLASQQAAASVGQGLLIERYHSLFASHGLVVGQVLLTVDDLTRQANYRNALRTFTKLMQVGAIPVVNENDTVATHEIRFGDNDRLAALVAHLVSADALVLLSDVDALYTRHPSDPAAVRLIEVVDVDDLDVDTSRIGSAVGTGGMATKVQAARIAAAGGISVVLAGFADHAAALAGQSVGTLFHPTGKKRSRRLMWLAYASQAKGDLVLDAGAVRAVLERKASLLPAGITAMHGDFLAGEPVRLLDPDGAVIARGIVNYDSGDLPPLLGKSTHALVEERGPAFDREVVHRDALIVKVGRTPR